MTDKLSHTDKSGKARMVDVGNKPMLDRYAKAEGYIRLAASTLQLVRENELKMGDVLTVAEIAGIQAAKRTHELIPLCHPIALTKVAVNCELVEHGIRVSAEARCKGETGVEMEALTAVQVALLTVYDMCKAVDKNMLIEGVKLLKKTKL
jgi:cyclic pyranopterin phosphate synthase